VKRLFYVFMVIVFVLTACVPAAPVPTATLTASATLQPTVTQTPEPTLTPTITQTPTETSTPTIEPSPTWEVSPITEADFMGIHYKFSEIVYGKSLDLINPVDGSLYWRSGSGSILAQVHFYTDKKDMTWITYNCYYKFTFSDEVGNLKVKEGGVKSGKGIGCVYTESFDRFGGQICYTGQPVGMKLIELSIAPSAMEKDNMTILWREGKR